jgi:hypothetical protein
LGVGTVQLSASCSRLPTGRHATRHTHHRTHRTHRTRTTRACVCHRIHGNREFRACSGAPPGQVGDQLVSPRTGWKKAMSGSTLSLPRTHSNPWLVCRVSCVVCSVWCASRWSVTDHQRMTIQREPRQSLRRSSSGRRPETSSGCRPSYAAGSPASDTP